MGSEMCIRDRYDTLGLKKGDVVKIGNITLAYGEEVSDLYGHLEVYIEYPKPDFGIYIKGIKYLGRVGQIEEADYLFNVTLELKNVGMVVTYTFDELGRKERISEKFVPLYLLTVERGIPIREKRVVERLNETYYLVAMPTATGYDYDPRCFFGGGFKDVWEEPKHEYVCSYALPSDTIWLKIEVDYYYVVNDTVTFITPWGQKVAVKVKD